MHVGCPSHPQPWDTPPATIALQMNDGVILLGTRLTHSTLRWCNSSVTDLIEPDTPTKYHGVPIPHNLRLYWHSGYLSIKYWQAGVVAALNCVADEPEIIEEWTPKQCPTAAPSGT